MDHYTLKERIGNGSYSQVFSAINTSTQTKCALKIMKHPYEIAQQNQQMEVSILQKFSSNPTIIKLIETFLDDGHLILVFELLQNSLIEYYKDAKAKTGKPLTKNEIKPIVYQVCLALRSMHQQGYAHRDVKPQNILIRHDASNKLVTKLVDFGLTKKLNLDKNTNYIATRWYRSPQLILNMPYDLGVDIFALGCLIIQLYLGFQAFPGADATDQLNKIFAILGTPTKDTWPEGVSVIDQRRIVFPTYEAVSLQVNIPGICEDGVDLLEKMLVCNPKNRIKIEDVLKHPYFQGVQQSLPKQVLQFMGVKIQTDGKKAQIQINPDIQQDIKHPQTLAVESIAQPPTFPVVSQIPLYDFKFQKRACQSQILIEHEPQKQQAKHEYLVSSRTKNPSETIDSVLASALNTQRNSCSIGLSSISQYRANYSLAERGILTGRQMAPTSDRSTLHPNQNQQNRQKIKQNNTFYTPMHNNVHSNVSPMADRPHLFKAADPSPIFRQKPAFSFNNNVHMRSPPQLPSPPMKKLQTILQKMPRYLPNKEPKFVQSQPVSVDSKKQLNYSMIHNIVKPQIRKAKASNVEKPETLHVITNKARPTIQMLSPTNIVSLVEKTTKKQPETQKEEKTQKRKGGQRKKKLQLTTNTMKLVIKKKETENTFCCSVFCNNEREITIEPKLNKPSWQ